MAREELKKEVKNRVFCNELYIVGNPRWDLPRESN